MNRLFYPVSILCLICISCADPESRISDSKGSGSGIFTFSQYVKADSVNSGIQCTVWTNAERTDSLVYQLHAPGARPKPIAGVRYIEIPVGQVATTSTTHLPAFDYLGRADAIVGFAGTQNIASPLFRSKIGEQIIDIGPAHQVNLETLTRLDPDVIFAYIYEGASESYDQMSRTGVPVVLVPDFLEPSPLARAEWIKFFGLFTGRLQQADSIFDQIVTKYRETRNMALSVKERPKVFSGTMYGDTWFAPGGKSWAATFFQDAGANYVFRDNKETGSTQLSYEYVVQHAMEAEYWVGMGNITNIAQLDPRYQAFKAVKSGKLYTYAKPEAEGGLLYFEEGYARPDQVLHDLVEIFHSHILPGDTLYYYHHIP